MSAPQSLLQAAANRLASRLGSGLADTAATLTLLAQDAPARLQQELSLFWEEVEQEAARLDREGMVSPERPVDSGSGAGNSSSDHCHVSGQFGSRRARCDLRLEYAGLPALHSSRSALHHPASSLERSAMSQADGVYQIAG